MQAEAGLFRVAMLLRIGQDLDRIRQVTGNQYLGCTFDYYEVNALEDFQTDYSRLFASYDGILTSGVLSDRLVTCFSGSGGIPHRYFAVSVEDYYRVILTQLLRDPSLRIGDIRLDMMQPEHNLPDLIEGNRLGQLMEEEKALISRLTPEQVVEFEKEMIHRYERSIQANVYKLFITRSGLAARTFREAGVPYVSMELTAHEIFKTIKGLRREMELNALKAGQVAAIAFDLGEMPDREQLWRVRQALERSLRAHGDASPVLCEEDGHLEILTDANAVYELTQGYTCCGLADALLRETGIPAAVGYGIGITMQAARENAAAAARYARSTMTRQRQSFLIGSDGRILPLSPAETHGGAAVESAARGGILEASVNRLAKRTHLSSRTVFSLMTALKKQKSEISADWVAREMQVSPRMANRILANLEKAGFARVTGKSLLEGKGRPCNIYTIRLEIDA